MFYKQWVLGMSTTFHSRPPNYTENTDIGTLGQQPQPQSQSQPEPPSPLLQLSYPSQAQPNPIQPDQTLALQLMCTIKQHTNNVIYNITISYKKDENH